MPTRRGTLSTSRTSTVSPFIFSRLSVASEHHPTRNEDALLVDPRRGLAAVLDGVGGSAAGDVASRLGAQTIKQTWKNIHPLQQLADSSTFDPLSTVRQLILEAQQQICEDGSRRVTQADPRNEDYPGATVVLAILHRTPEHPDGYMMSYAHVGDSRIYLLRGRETLQRLTTDDGYFTLQVEHQMLSEDDAQRIDQAMHAEELTPMERAHFERRNGITQSLSYVVKSEYLDIHVGQVLLAPGDRVLLCSDGIHDNLTDNEIAETLRRASRTNVAHRLVERAVLRSHEPKKSCIRAKADDMTAIVITVKS
ncbi:MAG TPA: PP2C family serine/threonine-protein phosphatase [Ktedonobacteraceae bacterium]|nr:PP2C family serine/threonine-protein phosphatase [Ktedonobacteraceae bacterium]